MSISKLQKALEQKAKAVKDINLKTYYEPCGREACSEFVFEWNRRYGTVVLCKKWRADYCLEKPTKNPKVVDIEDVLELFSVFQAEYLEAKEKNVEYAKLVAAQAEEYAKKMAGQAAKEQALRDLLKNRPHGSFNGHNEPDLMEQFLQKLDKTVDEAFSEDRTSFYEKTFIRKQLEDIFRSQRHQWERTYREEDEKDYLALVKGIFNELEARVFDETFADDKRLFVCLSRKQLSDKLAYLEKELLELNDKKERDEIDRNDLYSVARIQGREGRITEEIAELKELLEAEQK